MALHLITTLLHLGKAVGAAAQGDSAQVAGELMKTVVSIVPGNDLITGAVTGHAIDLVTGKEEITNAHMNIAAHIAPQAAHSAFDSVSDAIDAMGNGDGVADLGDIVEGVHHLLGSIFDSF
jgi:hypothetical protein